MVSLMEDELAALASYTNVPAELDRIVTRALRKNKKERYQTARELVHDLKELKQELQLNGRLKQSLGVDELLREQEAKSNGQIVHGGASASASTTDIGIAHPTTGEANKRTFIEGFKRHAYRVFSGAQRIDAKDEKAEAT